MTASLYPALPTRIKGRKNKMRCNSGGLNHTAKGMLGNYRFGNLAEDIRSSKLYGLNDDKLGKTEDVTFEHATGNICYLVVDTGGWLCTKKFIVPAHRIVASVAHKDDFAANLTKHRIESFPPYGSSTWNRTSNGLIM